MYDVPETPSWSSRRTSTPAVQRPSTSLLRESSGQPVNSAAIAAVRTSIAGSFSTASSSGPGQSRPTGRRGQAPHGRGADVDRRVVHRPQERGGDLLRRPHDDTWWRPNRPRDRGRSADIAELPTDSIAAIRTSVRVSLSAGNNALIARSISSIKVIFGFALPSR